MQRQDDKVLERIRENRRGWRQVRRTKNKSRPIVNQVIDRFSERWEEENKVKEKIYREIPYKAHIKQCE